MRILGAPLLYRPTADGVHVNVVVDGDPGALVLNGQAPARTTADTATWVLRGLPPATRHPFRIGELAGGHFTTARPPGAEFVFDVLTDSHVFVRDFSDKELADHPLSISELVAYVEQKQHAVDVLPRVAANIVADDPDFVVHLGDILDFHGLGRFNDPPPDPSFIRRGFLDYRELIAPLVAPHFVALGNWDGENGDYPPEAITSSRAQRRRYLPNPSSETYPEGGGPNDDYFAWTWGDALFVVLNVMTYTETSHRLWTDPGRDDDWTLGPPQLRWLERTLAASRARWKFLFIHHAVGGAGPDPVGAAYGRGGGLAARVGEQARVHELMLEHGVQIFFYGHDHVFTDMTVDGIHYTLPGRAGTNWIFPPQELGYERTWPDSGHARVRVTPKEITVEFVNLDRDVFYAYRVG